MPLSDNAKADVRAKLKALQDEHGSLSKLKADRAFEQAYPDAVDLHEWRMEWNRARHAERKPAVEAAPAAEAATDVTAEESPRRKKAKPE